MGSNIFLTIPIIVKLSITVYVDLGLIFFSTASLFALIVWLEHDFNWRWLLLCGICAGLAAGTKYNGLVTVAVIGLFVPFCYSRIASKSECSQLKLSFSAFSFAAVFATGVLLTFSPWLIRNYIWTGNPIYPLHQNLFANESAEQSHEENAVKDLSKTPSGSGGTNNVFINRRLLYGESALETLTLPFRFFFQGQDDNPKYFDGRLSPFLLFLPVLAFVRWKNLGVSQKRERLNPALFCFPLFLLYLFSKFDAGAVHYPFFAPPCCSLNARPAQPIGHAPCYIQSL